MPTIFSTEMKRIPWALPSRERMTGCRDNATTGRARSCDSWSLMEDPAANLTATTARDQGG